MALDWDRVTAKDVGIIENVTRLKMNYNRGETAFSSEHRDPNIVWVLTRDDGSYCPYFKPIDTNQSHCYYVSDFDIIQEESNVVGKTEKEIELETGMSKKQRDAVSTFQTMVERATKYRETGSYTREEFDPSYGICDNVDKCRPAGSSYDEMYRVKDNVIRNVASFSQNYNYPVKCPLSMVRAGRTQENEAERIFDNSSDKWSGDYGAERLIQAKEILEYVTNNWSDNLTEYMTPAQRRGITDGTVVMYKPTGTFWKLSRDDDSSSPYFVPLGNEGNNGRQDINLRDIVVMNVDTLEKRSINSYVTKANRLAAKRLKLQSKLDALKAEIDALQTAESMEDYMLSLNHKLTRIK